MHGTVQRVRACLFNQSDDGLSYRFVKENITRAQCVTAHYETGQTGKQVSTGIPNPPPSWWGPLSGPFCTASTAEGTPLPRTAALFPFQQRMGEHHQE